MSALIENLAALAPEEGYNATAIPGIGVYKVSEPFERVPLCYSQGVIIMAQGSKRIYFNEKVYDYNAEKYLVLTLPLPAECEAVVEPGKPLLSLTIDFDMGMLTEMVRTFDEHHQVRPSDETSETESLFVSQCTASLLDTVTRFSGCLRNPLARDLLAPGLLRELMFHILCGPQAGPMFALVSHNTSLARLERVLKHLHDNYQASLNVEQLAQMANMSMSSLHRHFRQITASSPIQYVKKIRLTRARELLLDRGLKVKQVAAQVGYESPTQFSREYKRYFGCSPQASGRA